MASVPAAAACKGRTAHTLRRGHQAGSAGQVTEAPAPAHGKAPRRTSTVKHYSTSEENPSPTRHVGPARHARSCAEISPAEDIRRRGGPIRPCIVRSPPTRSAPFAQRSIRPADLKEPRLRTTIAPSFGTLSHPRPLRSRLLLSTRKLPLLLNRPQW